MKVKPTPGPWRLAQTLMGEYFVGGPSMSAIAVLRQDKPLRAEANGRLIAAAPDLLAALKRAMMQMIITEDEDGAYMQAHRAIKKAEDG